MKKGEIEKFGLVVDVGKLPGSKVLGENERLLKVVMSPQVGNYDKATVLISEIDPGKSTGMHTHEVDEIMYVASGEGITICGGKENTVGRGSVIFAPKVIEHTVNNTGNEKLRLVCFFIPSMEPQGKLKEATEKTIRFFEKLSIC
ncbi:hypothetical protein ES703_36417 [subsurface metagenome]